MPTFNVLITGAKSGIGKALLAAYASRPDTIAIAAIRDDPTSEKAKTLLSSIKPHDSSKVLIIPYDAALQNDVFNCIDHLRNHHPEITHLDLVIANAAINNHWGPTHGVTHSDLSDALTVNTIAPILLYTKSRDLLLKSPNTPKFVFISSIVGSIAVNPTLPLQMPVMGLCKAATNAFAAKAASEEEKIVVFPVHPGWVQTAMGDGAANKVGMESAPMTVEKCCELLTGVIDGADKKLAGKFLQVEGGEVPW